MANKYDKVLGEYRESDSSTVDYLKLDQTSPQRVINGAPVFTKGLIIKAGEKLVFDGE